MNPQELMYSKTHEWVHLSSEDGNKVATEMHLTNHPVHLRLDFSRDRQAELNGWRCDSQRFQEVELSVHDMSMLGCNQFAIETQTQLTASRLAKPNSPFGSG